MAKKSSLKARKRAEREAARKPLKSSKKGHGRKDAMEFVAKKLSYPEFIAKDLGEGKLGITCPRNHCRGKVIVNKKKWVFDDKDYRFRGCAYCNNLAAIPRDLLPKGDPRR